MIVQILENKRVSQDTSFLCNQYDNESASIKINLPAIFINQTYLYFLICKSPDKTVNQYSVPLLLALDEDLEFIVNSTLSSVKGYWQFCLVIKEASGNLVAVTNYWTGVVKSGIIAEDELAEQVEDSNIKLANEAMLEAETLRVIAENQRDAAELNRISAEIERISVEKDRATAEQARDESESRRDTAETLRVTNENGRTLAETSRVAAEQGRATSETNRVNAEAVRAIAEDNRATAETTRETAEVTRKSNETSRQTAEQSRAAAEIARESSESTRIDKETARQQTETIRGTNETNRIAAETNRATAEGLRTTAETTRQTNEAERINAESLRSTAEQGRASAESDRVTAEQARDEAENIRAEFYDGFASELSDIATQQFKIKNKVINGNFENGITGWTKSPNVSLEELNDELKVNVITPATHTNVYVGRADIIFDLNNKYYCSFGIKIKHSSVVALYVQGQYLIQETQIELNKYKYRSLVFVGTVGGSSFNFRHNTMEYVVGESFFIHRPILVDLTTIFGNGNEPTKEEMDLLIELLGGWFDGEITVSQKTLANWYLKMIRQNRNAIIALGGTII